MKKFEVSFDVAFFMEVEAKDEDEALEKAKDNLSRAEEGEAHNFSVERGR